MFQNLVKKSAQALNANANRSFGTQMKAPVRVVVTGAAGNIGYATVFRIASGQMLGPDQPVILHLLDMPAMQNSLEGVKMELVDCSFPTLAGVVCTDSQSVGFKDVSYALLVGAKPRGPGMERADLLKDNGKIFVDTGKAINDNANRNVKVIVVGNPANTNCMIAQHYAKDLPSSSFTAMTRLDHNRALGQLTQKTNSHMFDVENFCIWGNHSPTMYPDVSNCTVNGKKVTDLVSQEWLQKEFTPCVQQRGAAIIAARKLSSAASAGNAAIEHIRDWALGCKGWTSMAVLTDGTQYGVPKGLMYSFPVTCPGNGIWKVVQGLKVSPESQARLDKTTNELLEERKAVEFLLK